MGIQINSKPTAEEIQEITEGVNRYNHSYLGAIRSQEFTCCSYNDSGEKDGGLYAELWGDWLLVKYLWVKPVAKRKGLGRKLLTQAEEWAKKEGCHSVFLDTYDFQARPFYEKQGYQVKMALTSYPVNGSRYYLVKQISHKDDAL